MPKELQTIVRGAHLHEFKGCLGVLKFGTQLKLVPEPNNQYDPNAVLVTSPGGLKIGYIPREQAPYVQKILNAGYPVGCTVDYVNEAQSLVRISLQLPDTSGASEEDK